jgi:hypothetical protein
MCASIGVTGDPRAANCPRRRAIALPHSRRLCAAAASLPPPLLDARKSVPSTAGANMCASIGVTGDPRAANCTVSAVAPSLSHSRFDCARPRAQSPQPLLDGRKSIASTTGATMCASIGATRDPRSGTLSAVAAQMLSDTGFGCARPRAQSPHLGLTLPPPVGLMHLRHTTRSGREIRGSENRLRIAPRGCARYHESEDTCAPVRVAASRIDPPAKRWRTIDFHATGIEAEEFEWRHSHNGSSNR